MNTEKLGQALANAPISQGEKEAWLKIIPHMNESQLQNLYDALAEEQEQLSRLREEYLEKAQEVIDKKKIEEKEEDIGV
ncbi:MAG: hypothetical protein ABEJ24_01775 [Candidatus Magasanikbacteria bacterium]